MSLSTPSSTDHPRSKRDRLKDLFSRTKDTTTRHGGSCSVESDKNSSNNDFQSLRTSEPEPTRFLLESQGSELAVDQGPRSSPRLSHISKVLATEDGGNSRDLWMHAYEALKLRDPGLVTAYERYLTSDDLRRTAFPSLSPELIESIVKPKLDDREASQLVVRLGREPIKVREQGEKIIKFILWSNDFISAAVSAQPYAALAWSGVSILLPLLLNASQQSHAMIEGLTTISDLLRLYRIKETVYLQAVDKPAHPDFLGAIEELYADIFEYQARLICYISRGSAMRGVRGMLKLDDWKEMLEKIKASDRRCNQYSTLFSEEKEHQFYAMESSYIEQSTDIQKRVLDFLEKSRALRQQERQNDKEAELLETLASDYKSDKDSISRRVPGTCEWFFEDERFIDWRDSKFSRLLWISAGPGCGKSVLSRSLIDERRVCTNAMTSTVCYFFFKDGQEQRTRSANALSAILHQLFENTAIIPHALLSYRNYGKKLRDTFSELWGLLLESAQDPEVGEIICVLDALDECEEGPRKQLINRLLSFFSQKESYEKSSFRLKFLITSRPYDDLEQDFGKLSGVGTYLRFDGDDKSQKISQEINLVIDAKIPEIAGDFSDEDRERISSRLKKMNNRTYLWLFLTIDIITRSRSNFRKISSIDMLLSDLPSKISEAYERILTKSSNKVLARILLQLIVAAKRPLSLTEVNIALTLATQKQSYISQKALELWPSQTFRSTVQNICGLFISVHEEKISLIHQTAREFLIRTAESRNIDSHKWQGCVDMATAHGILSKICIFYLNFDNFASTPQDEADDSETENENYPFLHYAALNWASHYVSQQSESARESQKIAQRLCDTVLPKQVNWFQIYCHSQYVSSDVGWTNLTIASWLGLVYVVDNFLNEGADVNAQGGYHGNALQAASFEGHKNVVQMLLEKGADVNAQGGKYGKTLYGNALQAASIGGHDKVVQILLESSAFVNAQGGHYGSALQAASRGGHETIVQTLLEEGADVNAQGGEYGSALQAASFRGHDKVVQILLEKGAHVNAQGGYYGNALRAASSEGHDKVIQILLRNGADVNAQSERHGNALQAASRAGHGRIFKALLEKGVDINIQGGYYGNALQAASRGGHNKIVQILLNQGASVNAQGGQYGNALQAASSGGYDEVVQILLETEADVYAQGGYYGNALQAASFEGHKKIMQILLERGADVNAQGGEYGSALQAASLEGHHELMQILFEKGAEVNAQGGYYGNALQAASIEDYDKVTVKMLLQKGADVNAQGGKYGNALQAASHEGHDEVVQTLLDEGADVNAQGGKYGNALQAASHKGHEKVVQVLLEKEADVNAQGGKYGNALQAASHEGHDKVVQILLENRAGVNAQGGKYGSALQAASHKGHEKVVQVLLDEGADIKAQGGEYGNALQGEISGNILQAASFSGYEKIVRILLEKGADVNAQDRYYGNALHAASSEGYEEIVWMLLEKGADVNIQVGMCGNALQAAAREGHVKIVQILLEKGAEVTRKDMQGRTPVHLASAGGSLMIVEKLLNFGSDLEILDKQGRSCLHHAASKGSIEVVTWLLQKGFDPNLKDRDDWSSLHWAAKSGSVSTMQILKEAGGNSSIEAIEGWTPHSVAVFHHKLLPISLDVTESELGKEEYINPRASVVETTNDKRTVREGVKHERFSCDGCFLPTYGTRYHCLDCLNFDFCFKCKASSNETHADHSFEKME